MNTMAYTTNELSPSNDATHVASYLILHPSPDGLSVHDYSPHTFIMKLRENNLVVDEASSLQETEFYTRGRTHSVVNPLGTIHPSHAQNKRYWLDCVHADLELFIQQAEEAYPKSGGKLAVVVDVYCRPNVKDPNVKDRSELVRKVGSALRSIPPYEVHAFGMMELKPVRQTQ